MAVLSSLLTIGLYLLLFVGLEGCNKFEIAKRKYTTNVVDTTYQTITTVVPKDSAVLVTRTDTTRVVLTERQGRATIIYQRDPKVTTIRAVCDTVVVEKRVPVYVKKQVWGVDPAYKDKAADRLNLIWVLMAIIVIGIMAYLFTHRFLLSLSKRDNGPAIPAVQLSASDLLTIQNRSDEHLPG